MWVSWAASAHSLGFPRLMVAKLPVSAHLAVLMSALPGEPNFGHGTSSGEAADAPGPVATILSAA